ncbi:MAG: SCO family protein [Aigarchaeota archaeon]|nr:SCO family protein [Aigarchaeota archaeon]MDW8092629.1 SCO family protein [Nitrososphaerota archaeon]
MISFKVVSLVTLLIVLSGVAGFFTYQSLTGEEPPRNWGVVENPMPAPEIRLHDVAKEGEFLLSAQRGKVVLIFFGYTNCPDVCPLAMLMYREIHERIRGTPMEGKVETVFITVDPYRDTPEALLKYARQYRTPATMLTGDLNELRSLAKIYGVPVEYYTTTGEKISEEVVRGLLARNENYLVGHGSFVYVVDRQGLLRGFFMIGTEIKEVLRIIEYVMRA